MKINIESILKLPDPYEHSDRVTAPPSSLAAAKELDDSSGRRQATPVRKSFVRSDTDADTPLSRLVRAGGRGGLVAIKLYLALLWRCSTSPYRTTKPGRAWATLLGLDDPEGNGARRIAAAVKTLQEARLIEVAYEPGRGNTITVLDESGDGSEYFLPSTAYARASAGRGGDAQRQHNIYFKIPSRLWTEGDIQSLKVPGLVMLLILLAEQADQGDPVWFATDTFPARYRISHKTRAAGTRELVRRQLLTVDREALPDIPGRVFDRQRYRNRYKVTLPAPALLPKTPDSPVESTDT